MNVWDFLQWLSVGGVSVLSLIVTSKNSSRSNEHQFIDQLQEELKRNSERLDFITKRLDDLESENSTLKELNYKLQIERDTAINDRDKIEREKTIMENDFMKKLDSLGEENKELRKRVLRLEETKT